MAGLADRQRRTLLAGLPALLLACTGSARAVPDYLRQYEAQTGGRIGLHARNLRTGARIDWRADERFVMCSTFKASLAALVLARIDRHEDALSGRIAFSDQDLLEYAPAARASLAQGWIRVGDAGEAMVELSDNTCANLLLQRVGGPAALTAFWRSVGDSVTRLDHNEPELNRSPPGDPRDTTTPAAMAATLQRLLLGDVLRPDSRALLRDWLSNCQTGAHRLRAGLAADRRIENKTGNNGRDAAGDIGLVWGPDGSPTVVCAYTQGGDPGAEQLEQVFSRIGRAVSVL